MPTALSNVSFDGSPVQFRLDSPLLVYFDPIALDMLRELLPADIPLDLVGLLERANATYPAVACYTIPDFHSGVFTLDPHDIRKFGDEEDDFDYGEGEQRASEPPNAPAFPFAAVDSGTLLFADVAHLPKMATLLSREQQKDCSLADVAVWPQIIEGLGGPYFAVIVSNSSVGMQFDGDGVYTISVGCVRASHG
jgi:hypothetical protein